MDMGSVQQRTSGGSHSKIVDLPHCLRKPQAFEEVAQLSKLPASIDAAAGFGHAVIAVNRKPAAVSARS
jgi:hypothetical protein